MNESLRRVDKKPAIYLREDHYGGVEFLFRLRGEGWSPIPLGGRRVDSYSGWRARGGLVSGAVAAAPIPSTGEWWSPIPLGG